MNSDVVVDDSRLSPRLTAPPSPAPRPPVARIRKRRDFLRAAKGKRVHCEAFSLQSIPREPMDLPSKGQDGQDLEKENPTSKASANAAALASSSGPSGLPARFGFTVTRKTGHAVQRNRIRRRLKEALRHLADTLADPSADLPAKPGHDYVIIARPAALAMPFCDLQATLRQALIKVDKAKIHKSETRKNKSSAPNAPETTRSQGGEKATARPKQPANGKTPRGRSNP
ncbi:ribonuclease P protein component [Beijerinckia indica]|uniref:Ribonuclease P protein component n=1 Tax=Beijerinckia indica subsp. indica (strain ATCC 9039 / DSM 1715 / NCIMB 8712) TaxID=395963 RepID=B2IDV4_BEII9|nr:ribonuclease P protein component [Beijerinckia indica]ACB96886.1 ribonuclease P protein component [Beijerinckia indica subsp. indica ATCC 9039]